MQQEAIVRRIAESMGILGSSGVYEGLDSLRMMEFIVRIEEATGLEIPAEEITGENFAGVATTVGLLSRVSRPS